MVPIPRIPTLIVFMDLSFPLDRRRPYCNARDSPVLQAQ